MLIMLAKLRSPSTHLPLLAADRRRKLNYQARVLRCLLLNYQARVLRCLPLNYWARVLRCLLLNYQARVLRCLLLNYRARVLRCLLTNRVRAAVTCMQVFLMRNRIFLKSLIAFLLLKILKCFRLKRKKRKSELLLMVICLIIGHHSWGLLFATCILFRICFSLGALVYVFPFFFVIFIIF